MAEPVLDITGAVRKAPTDPGTGRMPTARESAGKGVRAQHPSFAAMTSQWQKCRDVVDGERAMHYAGERYLARLKDQTNPEYTAMVERTGFYNATWRTIAGLRGMVFRKPPLLDVPPALEPLLKDVTLDGQTFTSFAQTVVEEVLGVGRVGVLADYPTVTDEQKRQLTLADAQALSLRPTLALYRTESIINWRLRKIGNVTQLALVVLREPVMIRVDEFTDAREDRYRVLDLTASGEYRQRLYKIGDNGKDEQVGGDVYPEMNGKRMDYIPFVFIGPDDLTSEVDEPPLIDLVDVNVHHYKVTCDYEHGCHFTGLPTPVVAGYSPPNPADKLYVGSTTAWVFKDPSAKWGYLEYSGSGLASLERNLDRKEQAMAVLGARMLEPQKRAVEAADTAAIHRVGEESALAGIASIVSEGLTRALQWFSDWAGAQAEVSVELCKEFFPAPVDPAAITTLMAQWQGGGISYRTYFDNLKKAEIFPPERTAEEEQQLITETPPMMLGGYPPQQEQQPPEEGAQ